MPGGVGAIDIAECGISFFNKDPGIFEIMRRYGLHIVLHRIEKAACPLHYLVGGRYNTNGLLAIVVGYVERSRRGDC